MKLSPSDAEKKTCKLYPPASNRPVVPSKKCLADDCVTYWRWYDAGHTEGYCALGGKPEY